MQMRLTKKERKLINLIRKCMKSPPHVLCFTVDFKDGTWVVSKPLTQEGMDAWSLENAEWHLANGYYDDREDLPDVVRSDSTTRH